MIRLLFLRDLFTKKEKWALALYFVFVGGCHLVMVLVITALKMFIGFMRLLNSGNN